MANPKSYVIFYSYWCAYSLNAIQLLKDKQVQYKGYNIDKINGKMNTVLHYLEITKDITKFKSSHTSRPIIFKYSQFLGGYTELKRDFEK